MDSTGVISRGVPLGISLPVAISRIWRIPSMGASSYSPGALESSLKMTASSLPGMLAQLFDFHQSKSR